MSEPAGEMGVLARHAAGACVPPPKGWPLFGRMLWPLLPAPAPGAQQRRRGQRLWGGAGVGCDPLGSAGGQRRGPGAVHRLVTPRITRCTRGCESAGGGGTHPPAGTQTWGSPSALWLGANLPQGHRWQPWGAPMASLGHRWHPRGTDGRRLLRCPARLAQPQPSIPPLHQRRTPGRCWVLGCGWCCPDMGLSPTEVAPADSRTRPSPGSDGCRGGEKQKGITRAGDLLRRRRFERTVIWPRRLFWRGSRCPAPSRATPGRGTRGLERGLEGAEMPGGTYESQGCPASPPTLARAGRAEPARIWGSWKMRRTKPISSSVPAKQKRGGKRIYGGKGPGP